MPSVTDTHRDRSLGLAIFGAAQILMGLACAALVPLTLVGVAISPTLDVGIVVPSLVLYGFGAVIFVTLGVGSIRARRWAQTLSLSLGWIWLITGVCALLFVWLAAPALWGELGSGAGLDAETIRMMTLAINLVLGVVYVLLPGAMVLFYRSPHVVATCRARDHDPGWASHCPQGLLCLGVAYAFFALSLVAMPSYGFVFPIFGMILSGAAGAFCWALVFVFCLALAWGTIRREPWAWWAAMIGCIIAAISSVATFGFVDKDEILEAMSLLPDQRLILEHLWPTEAWVHTVVWLVVWGSLAAYLLAVRRLFDSGGSGSGSEPPPAHSGC